MKWYNFYNNNLSVILGSKQGKTLKLVNPKHEDWASIQLLTLSVLTFLFTLLRYEIIFPGIPSEYLPKQINACINIQ